MSQLQQTGAQSPLISVIMPVYNVQQYVRASINTVLAQTYPNLELIVVDDGSTDGSAAKVDAAARADSRVRVFHRKNAGPSAARNFGLAQAKGEYAAFIDSDDLMGKLFLAKMYEAVTAYGADLAICGYTRFRGKETTSCHRLYNMTIGTLVLNSVQEVASLFGDTRTSLFGVSVWSKLYRMSIIRGHDVRFPEDVHYEEDCCFNIQYMGHIRRAVALPDLLYHWRQGNVSLSKKYRPDAFPYLVNGYLKRMAFYESIGMADKQYLLSNIMVSVITTQMRKLGASDMGYRQKQADIEKLFAMPEVQQVYKCTKTPRSLFSRKMKECALVNDAPRANRFLLFWHIKQASIDNLNKMKYHFKRLFRSGT